MSTHKNIDKICGIVLVFTLLLTLLFMNGGKFGVEKVFAAIGYENKLFDTSKVHTIDISMENWEDFIQDCKSETYYSCSLLIDGEAYGNAAIRGKGNTSLTQVEAYGNNRYSFKIEFDHYDSGATYHGLDKLCLNNIIQDNTYMKDFLAYEMMGKMGVASPLCSYVYITVNGQDWGLYLAVEGVEESFLRRNYGSNYGELYKPDSMDMAGGKGEGEAPKGMTLPENGERPDFPEEFGNPPGGGMGREKPQKENPESVQQENPGNVQQESPREKMPGKGMGNASDDVLLKYIDDETHSYSNIFDSAKTNVTEKDKARLIDSLKNLSKGEKLEQTVDIEKVIRYFVVHNFLLNFDSYTGSMVHNYYLYEKNGQMQMIPWDYNLSFGGFQSMDSAEKLVNYPIDSPVSGGSTLDRPMIAWIFSNEEYKEMYHYYFREFVSEYFDSGYLENLIGDTAELIAPYVEKDPTKFCTYEEFEKGVSTLGKFCDFRLKSIKGQLEGTIGSTEDTQEGSTLIDPGDLKITDMGSMEPISHKISIFLTYH